jgi:small-conductance mechanosensitive channel
MNDELAGILDAFDFSRIGSSFLVLLFAFVLSKVAKAVLSRVSRAFPDWKLKIEQVGTLTGFVIVLGSVSLAVFLLFRSREAAIAIGGSLGLAFAIGAKDIAASLLSGLFVVFDRSFQVGDRIRFGDIYGDVLSIGVRSTRVRTLDDSIVTIPNSQFMSNPVTSANAGALNMQVEVDIYIQYGSDLAKVKKLLTESAVASRFVFLEKPIQVLFKDVFVDMVFCTRARVKAYVIETVYEKTFESDLTERFQRAFRHHAIAPPPLPGFQSVQHEPPG